MVAKTSNSKNKIGITLNDSTLDKLIKQSEKLGMSKSAYISLIINQQEGGRRVNFG